MLTLPDAPATAIVAAPTYERHVGRTLLYTPKLEAKLLEAISAGLSQKQAALACGIGERTLHTWKQEYPLLMGKMEAARERARLKALNGIQGFGDKEWRAHEAWLKLRFPEYRQQSNVNVQTNVGVAVGIVCDEAQRAKLLAMRAELGAAEGGAKT